MGRLIQTAGGMPVVLYLFVIIFVLLMAANAANLVKAWHLIPRLESHGVSACFDAPSDGRGGILQQSLRAGVIEAGGGGRRLDRASALAAFQALSRKLLLTPRGLKAFGVIVLVVTLFLVGADVVRLYVELYERMAVVVGNYPFRKLFQAGCARIMVQALGGLFLFAVSMVAGFLFSGAVRLTLARQTDRLAALLSAGR